MVNISVEMKEKQKVKNQKQTCVSSEGPPPLFWEPQDQTSYLYIK